MGGTKYNCEILYYDQGNRIIGLEDYRILGLEDIRIRGY